MSDVSAKPLISIVVPCKGRVPYLVKALDSVVQQDFADWECLVVDDDADAETQRAVEHFSARDGRIRYFPRESQRGGGNVCRNQGQRRARGSWIMFFDSDDILFPDCLSQRAKRAETYPELDFIAFQAVKILGEDVSDELFNFDKPECDDFARFLALDWPWQTTACLVRRAFLLEKGIEWDEELATAQDVDFYLRILLAGARYRKERLCDYGYRILHLADTVGTESFSPRKLVSYFQLLDKVALNGDAVLGHAEREQAIGNLCYTLYFATRGIDDPALARKSLDHLQRYGARNRWAARLLGLNARTTRGGFLHFKTLKLFTLLLPNAFRQVPDWSDRTYAASQKGYAISAFAHVAAPLAARH